MLRIFLGNYMKNQGIIQLDLVSFILHTYYSTHHTVGCTGIGVVTRAMLKLQ